MLVYLQTNLVVLRSVFFLCRKYIRVFNQINLINIMVKIVKFKKSKTKFNFVFFCAVFVLLCFTFGELNAQWVTSGSIFITMQAM